jgi:hypothetical protein
VPSEIRAGLIVVLLVVFAAGIGIAVGERARPTPSPRPVPSPTTIALATATPVDPAEVERRAFAQPLVTGCATARAVWLLADGGTAIRWDGRAWSIPDPTLRSILAATCDQATVLAVGRGGSIVTVDDELRQVRPDRFGIDDLASVVRFPAATSTSARQQAIAVGTGGVVAHQTDLGWRIVPTGIAEDLNGVAHRGIGGLVRAPFAWIVGANGVSFRLMEQDRWERVQTGTGVSIRAVTFATGGAIAVGDRGTVLRQLDGADGWKSVRSGTDADLRAIASVGATTAWIVGDRGTVLELSSEEMRRIDLGTTCTLRHVFAAGTAIWVVGSDGNRGGAWRILPTGTDRWGTC